MTLLFSDAFARLVAGDPLVYVDAGARGGLEGPWAGIADERLHVVAFEPDPVAAAALAGLLRVSADIVPKALWSHAGRVALHQARVASTSSVHPPNFPLLGRFLAQHGEPRTTLATLEVECTDLDGALARLGRQADFIKIDTQGAEYEILSGAARALGDSILGAVVETWTTEVHRGQRLAGDVLRLMHDHGFELFDVSIAAAWHRRRARDVPSLGRRQIVGLDLLFLKEPALDPARFARPAVAAKAAAIAELYGVPELALELLELCVPPTAHERRLVDELRATLMTPAAPGNASAAPAKLHY